VYVGAEGSWRISASGHGERRRLGVVGTQPSISLRGHRLAYCGGIGADDWNIWRVQATATGRTAEPAMFISSSLPDAAAEYSPDGKRIAFASDRSGTGEVWVSDSDGLHPVQITASGKGESGSPRWSPDSKRIVFDSVGEGKRYQTYTINADGGKPKRLTEGPFENAIPSWSRDGKWIYFYSDRTGRPEIWKISPEGGPPRQVTTSGGYAALESHDGKWLYFTASPYRPTINKMAAGGGAVTEVLKPVDPRNFAVSGRGIYYQAPDDQAPAGSKISFFDFATKKSRTILLLRRPVRNGLTVSPDERWLLYAQVDYAVTDLMLVENFR
jgi:Tol biopolymer transport system component